MLDWEQRDTASVQAVLDIFPGVWARVAGMPDDRQPQQRPSDGSHTADNRSCEADLRTLSKRESQAAMFDRTLACQCRGASRTMLQAQAAQAARRAAVLRGEVFVRSGVMLRPPASCPRLGEPLTSLRESMLRDEASAETYRRLAEQTQDQELRTVLERFSCETAAAAAEKRRSILRRFA